MRLKKPKNFINKKTYSNRRMSPFSAVKSVLASSTLARNSAKSVSCVTDSIFLFAF